MATRRRRGAYPIGIAQRFFFADLLEKGRSPLPTIGNAHVERALAIMQGSVEGSLELGALSATEFRFRASIS